MSTELAEPPTSNADDLSFVDSFEAFMNPKSEPASQEPEPEPVKSEPVKSEPMKEIDDLAEKPDLELPTDEIDKEEPESKIETSKDNPYKEGSPQHRRFEEFRKENSELKRTLDTETQTRAQTEARLKEFEAKAARADELESKIKEYESKIAVTNITESEAYREAVAKPLQEILQKSDALAERIGVDPDELASVLEISDDKVRRAKFKELTSGLDVDPDDHYEMRELAAKVQPLKAKRQEILDNADSSLAELEAARTKQQQAELLKAAEARKATVDQVAERLTSKIPFLKSIEGVNIEELTAKVRDTDPSAVPQHLHSYNAIAGELLPKILKQFAKAQRTVEELSDDIATYRRQSPRLTPDTGGASDSSDDDEGLLERYKKQFGG
jgi:hypothetical protein